MNFNKLFLLLGMSSTALILPLSINEASDTVLSLYAGPFWGAYTNNQIDSVVNDHVIKLKADSLGKAAIFYPPITVRSSNEKVGACSWGSDSSSGLAIIASGNNCLVVHAGFKLDSNELQSLNFKTEYYDVSKADIDIFSGGFEF